MISYMPKLSTIGVIFCLLVQLNALSAANVQPPPVGYYYNSYYSANNNARGSSNYPQPTYAYARPPINAPPPYYPYPSTNQGRFLGTQLQFHRQPVISSAGANSRPVPQHVLDGLAKLAQIIQQNRGTAAISLPAISSGLKPGNAPPSPLPLAPVSDSSTNRAGASSSQTDQLGNILNFMAPLMAGKLTVLGPDAGMNFAALLNDFMAGERGTALLPAISNIIAPLISGTAPKSESESGASVNKHTESDSSVFTVMRPGGFDAAASSSNPSPDIRDKFPNAALFP